MADRPSFDLLNEPWILCIDDHDEQQVLSIRDIFTGEYNPQKIVGDSPTQDYAVIRVLLAIFWRAHAHELQGVVSGRHGAKNFDWGDWFVQTREQLVAEKTDRVVLDYLNRYEDRFDLLSPSAPFMQVADLQTKSEDSKPISYLVPEAAKDYFTMRAGAGRESLDLAEAARWLIHAQAYDYSGIKSGALGDERVKGGKGYPIGTGWTGRTGGTLVLGNEGLLETLILNTPKSAVVGSDEDSVVLDKPVWEREPDTSAQRPGSHPKLGAVPQGAADLATWQGRRIRLYCEDDQVVRVLIANGDRIPDAGKNVLADPMTPYRYSPNQSKKGLDAFYAQPYDANRTMWRALDALVALQGDSGFDDNKAKAPKRPATLSNLASLSVNGYLDKKVLDLELVSMEYGPQESSVASTFSANIGLPLLILRDDNIGKEARDVVRSAAEHTRLAATSLGWFAGQLLVAAGGEYEFGSPAADRFFAHLEPRFVHWMRTVNLEDADESAEKWQRVVRQDTLDQAQELLRGAGTKAIIGRVVEGKEGGKGRIVTAGSLYRQLNLRLNKDLPLTAPQKEAPASPEHNREKESSHD